MAYAERVFACEGCGHGLIRRASAKAKVYCIECAITRSVTASLQIRARSGEFYRAWAEGMTRAAAEASVLADLADIEAQRR